MNQHGAVQVVAQVGLLFALFQSSNAQETSVDCPGREGRVQCEQDQVAICWLSDSSSLEKCLTPPEGVTGLALDLWLLSYVLDDTITVTETTVESYKNIIREGRWKSGTFKVAFALPKSWSGSR